MLRGRLGNHSNGIIAMAAFVFMLTAVPKMNIRVGPVPLYLIDLLIVLVVFYATKRPSFGAKQRPFQWIVVALFGFAMISEFVGFIYTGSIFEHAYTAARLTLAFLVFYATGQLVRTPQDLELILRAAALGVIVTSSMMILTSLPQTRDIVAKLILNNTFLDPAGEQIAEKYLRKDDSGARGRTLVGVSIMGASFINMAWPLAALLYGWHSQKGRWRTVAMVACFLAPMGVLMSYSRGPILGTIIIILFAAFFGLKKIKKGITLPVGFGIILILYIGVNSEVFFFDRLANRTAAVLDNPLEDPRESERLLAYVEPFEHLIENPSFLVVGQGIGINKARWVVPEVAHKASHALFAIAYYSNGMIAAFLYMYLLFSAFYYAVRHVLVRRSGVGMGLSHACLGMVLGLAPWAAFGHAMVSQPRGAIMFHSTQIQRTGHANSRHLTV